MERVSGVWGTKAPHEEGLFGSGTGRGPKGEGNPEQDSGLWGLGHGDLESWYRLKKEEGAAGSVLGGGSSRVKRRCVWLVIPLDVKKMESLVGETPGRGRL